MSQVAKFIEKGLQQTISTKIQTKPITEKHTLAEESDTLKLSVPFEGKNWKISVNYEYDSNADYVYEIEIKDKENKDLKIFINLKHPFIERFFSENISGISILISYFSITEIFVWQTDGVREASLVRQRFNNMCRNLPPRT